LDYRCTSFVSKLLYLTEEKRPQLFASLADDLQPLCISLQKFYLDKHRDLNSQPREIEAMKAQELTRLNHELKAIGIGFNQHIADEVNQIVVNRDPAFEEDGSPGYMVSEVY
jgi:hypothetical protein